MGENTERLKLKYLQDTYEELMEIGYNQDKSTWLVKRKGTARLYVWKEIDTGSVRLYNTLKEIVHRNLVPIKEVIETENGGIVIEEYFNGDNVATLLEQGALEQEKALEFIRQLLEALIKLQEHHIVHRDINPNNVLVSTDGQVKLIDFGIAREQKKEKSQDTTILGTVGYAAPEQFGFQQTDGRTDIYSLGVLFHVMLTGRLPIGNVCEDSIYQNFIKKCIRMEPTERYQNAREAYADLFNIEKKNDRVAKRAVKKEIVNPYIPMGFRSGVRWKKAFASTVYFLMCIYCLCSVAECAKTPLGFLMELGAVFLYIVLSWVIFTNYGNWYQRLFPFKLFPEQWEMAIRVSLFFVIFYYGFSLEEYVKYTMLGIARK